MSGRHRAIEITDPLALFFETGDRRVIVCEGPGGGAVIKHRLTPEECRVRGLRLRRYQETFGTALRYALSRGAIG